MVATMTQCQGTCAILDTVLTEDEMLTLVEQDPLCVPLCLQEQLSGPFISREGVGLVVRDTPPKDDLTVVAPQMHGRVRVPGVPVP